jgi:hypothetical protein
MVEVSERADLIERKIDRAIADDILISPQAGGVDIRKLGQVMEAAKLMALSGSMVPKFLRENAGGCFGIIWKGLAWGMDPFAVASMAYEVENRRTREKTVAYMSQLIHAIIEARAPIKRRLAVRYEGEGDDRVCIVSGTFLNEDEPREHRSPRLGDRKPKPRGRDNRDPRDLDPNGNPLWENDDAPTAGSPLWKLKPDVQLWYDTSRDWARIYCPDVLLGIYTKEEMEEVGFTSTSTPPVRRETPPDDGGFGQRLSESALARVGFMGDQAMAAADEAVAKRDEPAPTREASGGSPEPETDPAATPAPPDGEARPRASRSRRRAGPPEGDDARLV